MKVSAIVVTYRRPEVLASTLAAISAQTSPPISIVVVDNDEASGDNVLDIVAGCRGDYIRSGGNVGYGAGIAIGLTHAASGIRPDAYWVLDDDSAPAPDSLATLIAAMTPSCGVVANRGGRVQWGRIRHDLDFVPAGETADADFTLVDGALITSAAVDAAGLPRDDLFMMLEDFEYTTRIKQSGFSLTVVGGDTSEHLHLGSGAAWRGYYQARNLLRIALDRRSPGLLFGWVLRETAIGLALTRQRNFAAIRLRWRGTWHALAGRMGHIDGLP